MSVYSINFEIEYDNQNSYSDRYDSFMEAVLKNAGLHWKDPTSCIVIQTSEEIGDLAARLKASKFDPRRDLFMILDTEVKSARICGKIQDRDIFKLIPFLVSV
jgi:hypothetical protein